VGDTKKVPKPHVRFPAVATIFQILELSYRTILNPRDIPDKACHMKLQLLLFTFLQLYFSAASAEDDLLENLLVLGDSWASISKDYLRYVCSPHSLFLGGDAAEGIKFLNVQNDAKSGSTAAQWASKELAKRSFQKSNDFEYVWLSIGGNDFLSGGCDMETKQEIAADILSIISHIVESSSNNDIKILYFGYTYPTTDVCGGGTTAAKMDEISNYVRDSIGNSSSFSSHVTLVDITSELVTPKSAPLSDKQWFADSIHINEYGYFKIFSMPAIQEFFGCIEPAPSSSPTDSSSSASSYAPFVVPTTASTSETDEDGALSEAASPSSESSCRKLWMPWLSVGVCLVVLLR